MVPVVLIAALGRNGAIGRDRGLPWRLPGDLRRFRAETMGKPVIMGRRTFASLGRPLAGRHLVVVTRDPTPDLPAGVEPAGSLDAAFRVGQKLAAEHGAGELMVAGGAEIYRAALDRADALRLTMVDLAPEADTFFPPVDPAVWREERRESVAPGPGDEAAYALVEFRRR